MIYNKYEETYYCVWKGAEQTQYINDVVEFLKAQTEPVPCSAVGRAIFGKRYDNNGYKSAYASRTAQMLKHLCKYGFANYIEVKNEPYEVEVEGWIVAPDENGELPRIKVHDEHGNEYEIDNPKYSLRKRRGHWGKIKKTVTPTTRKYFWVEN